MAWEAEGDLIDKYGEDVQVYRTYSNPPVAEPVAVRIILKPLRPLGMMVNPLDTAGKHRAYIYTRSASLKKDDILMRVRGDKWRITNNTRDIPNTTPTQHVATVDSTNTIYIYDAETDL